MHRAWMDIKSTLTSNDDEVILNEITKGQKAAIDEYNDKINDITWPSTTQKILTNHLTKIKTAFQSARNFEKVIA